MRLYETAIVIDPQQKSEDIEDQIKKVASFITNHGGEVTNIDEWGKKRLAYEINKKQYGYYVIIRFNGPGQLVSLLEREYRLSENVLRYLTLKVEKHQLAEESRSDENVETDSKEVAVEAKPKVEAVESAEETPEEEGEVQVAAEEADEETPEEQE